MLNKFIVEDLLNGSVKEYKNIRQISNELNIDYFHIRSVYLESTRPKKYLHPITKRLMMMYKIYDNPNVFNPPL
jgi:hypothetical protein